MKGTLFVERHAGRELLIYLPPSYDQAQYPLPVVYVQDSGDLFDPVLNGNIYHLELRFAAGTLPEMMLVGIVPNDRIHEYTPWSAQKLEPGRHYDHFGGRASQYLYDITHKVKPWVDRNFYTDPRPECTGIVGKSLGGLVSLFAAYVYPEVFGRIGAMSASLWYEGFVEFMAERQLDPHLRIYMDIGSLEGTNKTSRQRFMQSLTDEAAAILSGNELQPDQLHFIRHEGEDHESDSFYRRFPEMMDWLFARNTVRLLK
ncbi:alpha/beta hydrolase [Paenibacillus sp. WLX1005]|uniref:alpha/beta hydrolase n=1 Tax=unclassified Paenibacillus TaxID=185978 RepID=UPI0039845043